MRLVLATGCLVLAVVASAPAACGPVVAAMALLIFAGRKAFRWFTTHRPQTATDLGTLPKVSRSLRACGPRRRLSGVRGCVVAGTPVDRAAGPRRAARRPGHGGRAQALHGVRRAGMWSADLHPGEQLPVRARCTTRLRTAVLDDVIDSGRAVAEVAADYGVMVDGAGHRERGRGVIAQRS